jgi:hypothetical protein
MDAAIGDEVMRRHKERPILTPRSGPQSQLAGLSGLQSVHCRDNDCNSGEVIGERENHKSDHDHDFKQYLGAFHQLRSWGHSLCFRTFRATPSAESLLHGSSLSMLVREVPSDTNFVPGAPRRSWDDDTLIRCFSLLTLTRNSLNLRLEPLLACVVTDPVTNRDVRSAEPAELIQDIPPHRLASSAIF